MITLRVVRKLYIPLLALLLAAPSAAERIDVGRISDLDLGEVQRLIDASSAAIPPAATATRQLTLEDSLRVALENNLDIQIAVLGVEAQAPEIAAAKAGFHPVTGLSVKAEGSNIEQAGAASNDFDREEAAAGITQPLPTGGQIGFGAGYRRDFSNDPNNVGDPSTTQIAGFTLTAKQPLLRGGRTFVARKFILNAELDAEIEQARLDGEILRVTAQTKGAYYQALAAARQIEVIESALARDQELIEYSGALFEAGRVSKRDVISAEIQLTSDEARLSNSRVDLELSQNNLRDVIGLPIEVRVDTADRTIPFQPVPLELEEWLESAYVHRPELLALDKELERMDLNLRIRRNDTLPQLDVSGEYQRDITLTKGQRWKAGLDFSLPFGNVAARSLLAQAEAQMSQLRREKTRTKRNIELEVRAIEIRLREGLLRIRTLATGVEQARAKREIARGRFQNGLANNLDITDADAALVRAETDLLRGIVEYATNLAELEAKIVRKL